MSVSILATIFFEKQFWVGTFERTDVKGYSVARHIFGGEPSASEIHQFILDHYEELKFGEKKEFNLEIKRVNPKRLQREVRKEMQKAKETKKPSTLAQDYIREELEKNKKEKRMLSREQKEQREKELFQKSQLKKKKKQKGR